MKTEEQCKKCGDFHNDPSECTQDYFSMYNYAKLKGIDLDSQKKSKLKLDDIVILNPNNAYKLYDGVQFQREQYKQIHQENIKGTITDIGEIHDHYCWGEYAIVKWDNGHESDCIEVSWLQKYE
jgi:hypothetical protein